MGSYSYDGFRIDLFMEKNKMRTTLVLMFLFLFMISGYSQTEWELKRVEDGITAYTRKREGIKFKEYKVVMELEASLDQILAIFKDFSVYTDLFPGTENIKVLHDEPEHHITYIKFNIPFPARDRDALFDNYLSFDQKEKELKIDVTCLTDEFETNPKLIQITFCDGKWKFKELDNGNLALEHTMIVDPAGKAPAWIVNAKTVDDPIKTLKSLRSRISDNKYRGHSFTLLGN